MTPEAYNQEVKLTEVNAEEVWGLKTTKQSARRIDFRNGEDVCLEPRKKEIKIKRTPALKSLKEPPNRTDSLQALQENITSENETNREQVTGIEQENLTA